VDGGSHDCARLLMPASRSRPAVRRNWRPRRSRAACAPSTPPGGRSPEVAPAKRNRARSRC
jgi:hypothetical protein